MGIRYADYTKADIKARKDKLERESAAFDAIRERRNALSSARRAADLELSEHHKKLINLEIAKFSIWADQKMHLEATIAAYDQALKLVISMFDRAEIAYKRAQHNYNEVRNG